jgi:hypothetical protein
MEELEKSPDTFDITNYDVSHSISSNETMVKRLVDALDHRRERIRMLSTVQAWEESNSQRIPDTGEAPYLRVKL